MSNKRNIVGLCLAPWIWMIAAWFNQASAQSSVLASGKWYKVAIEKPGVYRIDFNLFRNMGFDPANVDPRRIKIYGNGGGMLPQANQASRPVDLIENAIFIQGEADGVFHQQDYILFYADGADKFSLNEQAGVFQYEKNLYAKENYYYITVGETPGKRIQTTENLGNNFTIVNQFENFMYHELDQYNHLKSGREWYGERFSTTTELTIAFNLSNVTANSDVIVISDVVTINAGASSISATSYNLSLNGNSIGQQNIVAIPYLQYGLKGRHALDTFRVNASTVSASGRSQQEIKYQYNKSASGTSVGYLDYLLLQVTQSLALYGNQTIFTSLSSLAQPVSRFDISQSNSQTLVWDITNPYEPALQVASFAAGVTSFATSTTTLKNFIAFLPGAPAPKLISEVANQNIHAATTPDLIIVAHPNFKYEAQRLANHRQQVSNWNVLVFTTSEVYNEFSSGKQDVSAIRDMARFFYDKNPGVLKALLLFGKCSYDYKDILVDNKNFVPTYESRNSLHPLQTYSSDDFFGFMEDDEGEWGENPAQAHSLDIAVGRLPVKSVEEAVNVVDKIIQYETNADRFGQWRKNMVFIADDGDFNIHQGQANQLSESIELNHAQFNTQKIYLDAFPQIPGAGGERSPEAAGKIEKAFNDGALIINYTGHGGERIWAQERIFDDLTINRLKNRRLPLLVTATCEFGRQDDPVFTSGGELCLLQKDGGAIGLVTTARPVSSSTNFELNQAFYAAFFQKENGNNLTLGEIFRRTKNTSIVGVSNRNFSLIGDPSLKLGLPDYKIHMNEIVTADGSEILKALSTVTVSGEVVNDFDERIDTFSGTLKSILFDKETSFVTLGNENQPYNYTQWYNSLFRGNASVSNGTFTFQFVIPKNIAYSIDEGKLSLYAFDKTTGAEASGFSKDFSIGSSEANPVADNKPPVIKLYMGDTTFVNGGLTSRDTRLVARLYDDNGINISGYGIGNSITAVLDDSESVILNDYYEADLDDFTKGTIIYEFNNLSPGKHTITLQAWDTHNNPAQAKIDFYVTDGTGLVIEEFANYPNPFNQSTTLFFTHNMAGDDLDAMVAIYDYTGHLIWQYEVTISNSSYQVNLAEFSTEKGFRQNMQAGLYMARLIVRSLANGSKNERVTKLIISN